MLSRKLLNSSTIFVFVKYFNLFLGFIRTSIVAILLTKYQMGNLALVYLIMEYASYLYVIGSPNAINLQVSILRNKESLEKNNQIVCSYYTIFFTIIFFNFFVSYTAIFFATKYFNNLFNYYVLENIYLIIFGIFSYSLKAFCNMHNRLWEKYNRFMFAELFFSVSYLLLIYFFLKPNDQDAIRVIIFITIISSLFHVIISRIDISIRHFITFSKKNFKDLLPLGAILMLQNLMELYFWGIDRLFISIYLNSENLAEFHLSHTYARGLMMFFSAFTFLIYPNLLTQLSNSLNNKKIISELPNFISFTENILIFAFIFYIASIPYLITFILNDYKDLFFLFSFILMGLIIKSMTFFTATFLIARKKQMKIIILSFVFMIFTVLLYNTLSFFKFTKAEDFTLVAILIFLFFSIYLLFTAMKMLGCSYQEILKKIFTVYSKFTLLFLFFAFLFYANVSHLKSLLYINIFILLLYFKNLKYTLVRLFNYIANNILKKHNE